MIVELKKASDISYLGIRNDQFFHDGVADSTLAYKVVHNT